MQEQKFYIQYPLRQSRFKSGYMQIFYAVLGLVWIGAAIYLYIHNPSNNIILPIIYLIVGIAIGAMAYFYPKLFLGKYISISDAGIYGLLPSQKEIKITWNDVEFIDIREKALNIQSRKVGLIQVTVKDMYDVEWEKLKKALNKIIQEKQLQRD